MSEQPSTSPPPAEGSNAAAGPTPQAIGVRFVKAYYQALSTTPDVISNFYQRDSCMLSHGEGSTPTNACAFDSYNLADRWGATKDKRFDFDNGAIDAQPSANGSILLVVTGSVVMKNDGKEMRKGFVHTFFLARQGKNYFVHNDILRFLTDEKESPAEKSSKAKEEEPAKEKSKEAETDEAPGGGVEETKEPASDEDSGTPPASEKKAEKAPESKEAAKPKEESTAPVEEKKSKKKRGGRGKSPQQNATEKQQPESKPVPGSWASLVASTSAAPPPSPAPTPKKTAASEKKQNSSDSNKNAKNSKSQDTKENGKSGKDKPKRDPDNTLVIKNLAENTKEAELLALFEKFVVQSKSKIVSSTISSNRGLAFVDFDSVAPVLAAVEQHAKDPIQLNGRVLEVDQKTAEQRARKARGGGGRSGSPNQNKGGGGGGRQNQKKDRGGGEKGRSGAKGNRGGR